MDSMPVVFDISSDEEGWGEIRGGGICGGGGGDDYDWISELLEKVHKESDDSDDVVIVGEVVLNPKPRPKSSSVAEKPPVKDLDDDCVILDGDPDKPVVIKNNDESDSDDLLIVGEKGQVACRDYPHPRHDCAKFPFGLTQHEKHCHQCHCYVCDSLAPCVHWGNATSSTDHCHATDKDEFWKLQRRNLKQGNKAPPVPKLPDASVSVGPPPTIPVPPLPPPLPTYVAQNQVSKPTTIRSCTTSSNFSIPSIRNQGRSQQSAYVVPRNKLCTQLVSQQLQAPRNNIVRRDRRYSAGNLGPQFVNSPAIFKRAGSPGVALTNNLSGYASSNNKYVTQYSRNPPPMDAASNDKNLTSPRDFSRETTSGSNTHGGPSFQSTGSRFGNSVPSQPIDSNVGRSYNNSVPSPQAYPQAHSLSMRPNRATNFEYSVPSQSQVTSQPHMGSNHEYSLPSQPQPNTGCSFVPPVPSQPQVYSHPIPTTNNSQNALDPSFSDFNTSWVAPTGQSNQQPDATDDSQTQSAGPAYHPPYVPEFGPQIPVSTNGSSLDYQYESWVLDNQSVCGAPEVSVPPGWNVYSPEPAPVDEGLFFDF